MKNPSQFQASITAKIKPGSAKGIAIHQLRPVRAVFGQLDTFTTAAVINLAESITKRGK